MTNTKVNQDNAEKVVNSWNEWDPLEEVIVGVLDGAVALNFEIGFEAVTPVEHMERSRQYHDQHAGKHIEGLFSAKAQRELDEFVHILEGEGVTVRRPEPLDHARPIVTPHWTSPGGNCQANPRDVLIVFGNEILEAPMAWRSRYFEFFAYRSLCMEYFRQGARWTAAPKPQMTDRSYNYSFKRGTDYVTTEFEPLFDAADMMRCGKDIFVQRSHVTNDMGIEWLRRQYGDQFTFHKVEFDDYRAIHIDATFVPLAPGKILINPDRPIKEMPEVLAKSDWEFLTAPRSTLPESNPAYHSFRWLSMNMLSLDEKRVIVEASEEPTIKALRKWGFDPIPCPFRNNYRYGGSFHCATVDIRRRGELQCYF
jgi:glycine amidinotransferase